MIPKKHILALAIPLLLLGCQEPIESSPTKPTSYDRQRSSERLLGLAVGPSSQDYGQSFKDSLAAGSMVFEIPQQWKESGTKDNTKILRMLSKMVSEKGIPVVLTLNPLDTMNNQIPDDLQSKNYDAPEFTTRFKTFVDQTLKELRHVNVRSVSVGNEVDILLGDDPGAWAQYANFFREVKTHITQVRPDVVVGVKCTLEGLKHKKKLIAPILDNCDRIMMTYYPVDARAVQPVNQIQGEIESILATYPDKKLHLNEFGFPHSPKLGSSLERQSEFVTKAFEIWDQNPQIELMNFVWLNDMTPASVAQLTKAMGDTPMVHFLSTLGLRDHTGNPKPAFEAVRRGVHSRGFLE